jgi:dTDP-4-dehydrorhamnose 3,5-epimerase
MSFKNFKGAVFSDDRGFLRFVNDFDFSNVKRFYQVENHKKGFIRAWHGHEKEGKYVYVSKGTALVGAVDMKSETVNKFVLSSQSPSVLYIPPGYANGFKNLEDETIIMFFSTSTLEESKGDDIRFEWDKWNIWEDDYR